tara:strand:- start:200 stop:847 length:648 start_codon:yes stop_codon:yes gene_type:complete
MNKLLLENKSILSEGLQFHLIESIGIENNIYRPGSSKYFSLFREVRDLSEIGLYELNPAEKYFINETDIGEWDFYDGQLVPLDYPIVEGDESLKPSIPLQKLEEKRKRKSSNKKKKTTPSGNLYKGRKVELNKPKRGGSKKFYVYVKNPKTKKIKKVEWGAKGMSVGISDPKRRKSFAARHRCHLTKDKTTASYWACRTGRYPHLTGSKKKYTWW